MKQIIEFVWGRFDGEIKPLNRPYPPQTIRKPIHKPPTININDDIKTLTKQKPIIAIYEYYKTEELIRKDFTPMQKHYYRFKHYASE